MLAATPGGRIEAALDETIEHGATAATTLHLTHEENPHTNKQ